jgi:hypothetical protein
MSEARAPSGFVIERSVSAWQRAREALAVDGELADDEAVLARALDADPAALAPDELLRRLIAAATWADRRADEARLLVNTLRARTVRYTARGSTLRALALEVMDATNRKTFAAPFGTVSVKSLPPSVVILDEQALPDEYVATKRIPDKRKLAADLKEGVVINGAVLSNAGRTLAIRSQEPLPAAEEGTDSE